MPDIKRGDIFYIRGDYPPTGSEQGAEDIRRALMEEINKLVNNRDAL